MSKARVRIQRCWQRAGGITWLMSKARIWMHRGLLRGLEDPRQREVGIYFRRQRLVDEQGEGSDTAVLATCWRYHLVDEQGEGSDAQGFTAGARGSEAT